MEIRNLRGAALGLALLAPCVIRAQALPDARAVLARYAEATNAAKVTTFPGHYVTGTFELPAAGLKGTMEGYSDHRGRASQVITVPGIGAMREGVDTAFAWSLNPLEGPKLIEGKEFEETREREDPRAMRRDPSLVISATTLERTTADGEACVKVQLKWKSGRETKECYSEKTGLLIAAEGTETSSMGDLAVSTSYSEYKTFNGITMPTKTVQRAAGNEIMVRLTDVVFGPLDAAKLAVPPEIQALRKK